MSARESPLSIVCQVALGFSARLDATQLVPSSAIVGERLSLAIPIVHPLFTVRAIDLVAGFAGWTTQALDAYLRESDEPLSPPSGALEQALEAHPDGRHLILRELEVLPRELWTPGITAAYADVERINQRAGRLIELAAPEIILNGELRTLSRAVLALLEALRVNLDVKSLGELDALAAAGTPAPPWFESDLGRARTTLSALGFELRLKGTS